MFERFLKEPRAMARHQGGPMAEERRRYLAHCYAKEQTKPETLQSIANYLLIIAEAMQLDKRPGELISPAEVEVEVHRWVTRPRPQRTKKLAIAFRNRVIRWLTFLGRMQLQPVARRPYTERIAQYIAHLRQERGLASVEKGSAETSDNGGRFILFRMIGQPAVGTLVEQIAQVRSGFMCRCNGQQHVVPLHGGHEIDTSRQAGFA